MYTNVYKYWMRRGLPSGNIFYIYIKHSFLPLVSMHGYCAFFLCISLKRIKTLT